MFRLPRHAPKESLDHSIFERVKADRHEDPAANKLGKSDRKCPFQILDLAVNRDPNTLKGTRRWVRAMPAAAGSSCRVNYESRKGECVPKQAASPCLYDRFNDRSPGRFFAQIADGIDELGTRSLLQEPYRRVAPARIHAHVRSPCKTV